MTETFSKKLRIGQIHADSVTFDQALDRIAERVRSGRGGYVVTPNVDHVCLAETDERLRAAYAGAFLSLVDGIPLVWLSRLMRQPLPEKISGSDLIMPLIARAARDGFRLYFLGGMPGVADKAVEVVTRQLPNLKIAGVCSPPFGFEKDPAREQEIIARLTQARPDIILVALGCPKQELWMHKFVASYHPSLALGVGASIDFIAGTVKRAPAWMSRMGCEWLYRLAQEPTRMYERYLVRDRAFASIVLRMLRMQESERTF